MIHLRTRVQVTRSLRARPPCRRYIVISALVMLSLFIGAVTMSMTESMDEMKEEMGKVHLTLHDTT